MRAKFVVGARVYHLAAVGRDVVAAHVFHAHVAVDENVFDAAFHAARVVLFVGVDGRGGGNFDFR